MIVYPISNIWLLLVMTKTEDNGQLEPKKSPECTTLEKDSETCAEPQTNCNCNCEEVR